MVLHRALDGDGPLPLFLWVGRVCEEFPALTPTQALYERERLPPYFLERVIEARQYAECKHRFESAKKKSDLPKSRIMDLVKAHSFQLAREAREKKRQARQKTG